jgi:hypothetical protein
LENNIIFLFQGITKLPIPPNYLYQKKHAEIKVHGLYKAASQMVREQRMSVYKVSKEMKIPWNSLKRYLSKTEGAENNAVNPDLPKLGRPFALRRLPSLEICLDQLFKRSHERK